MYFIFSKRLLNVLPWYPEWRRSYFETFSVTSDNKLHQNPSVFLTQIDSPSVLIKQHQLRLNYKAAAGSICIHKWANIRFQIMFIHPCLPKLVINIFGSCGMVTLSLWISCVWACWGEGVGGDMSVQGQYHSRGRKERGHKGEGTGRGTENSLLGWNCFEAPTNHKTLLGSLFSDSPDNLQIWSTAKTSTTLQSSVQ